MEHLQLMLKDRKLEDEEGNGFEGEVLTAVGLSLGGILIQRGSWFSVKYISEKICDSFDLR